MERKFVDMKWFLVFVVVFGGIAIFMAAGGETGCRTVKGQKGVNGGGNGGDATICGKGIAIGGGK